MKNTILSLNVFAHFSKNRKDPPGKKVQTQRSGDMYFRVECIRALTYHGVRPQT